MRTWWWKPSFWWLNDKLRWKPMIQIDPWDRFIKRLSWTRPGKKRNINGKGVWKEKGRVSASREVLVRYHTNNPQKSTIPHHQLLNLPHDRTTQVLSIGGNQTREPKLTQPRKLPRAQRTRLQKERWLIPHSLIVASRNWKPPSVLKIKPFLLSYFFAFVSAVCF